MERRNLLAALAVLALSLFVLSGTALAHTTRHKRVKPHSRRPTDRLAGNVCDPHDARILHGSGRVRQLLERRRRDRSRVRTRLRGAVVRASAPTSSTAVATTSSTGRSLRHRVDHGASHRPELHSRTRQRRQRHRGRARRALVCGRGKPRRRPPRNRPPSRPSTTGFTVVPPRPTDPQRGRRPPAKARSRARNYSDVATIVQVEFPPVFAEEPVNVNAAQLYARCKEDYRLDWIVMGPTGPTARHPRRRSDAVAWTTTATPSWCCSATTRARPATSLIEASLENAPYTTFTTNFTVEPPQPTFH